MTRKVSHGMYQTWATGEAENYEVIIKTLRKWVFGTIIRKAYVNN
jgi:hypothetical protein